MPRSAATQWPAHCRRHVADGVSADIIHGDFKAEPYWWDAAPRRQRGASDVPRKADIAIIGSGYTGLSAALTLARAGREVVVLERDSPGFGSSSRNAGYVGSALLAPFSQLIAKYGASRAVAWYGEAKAAFDYTTALIEREQIRCDYFRSGRVFWAYTQAQLDGLEHEFQAMRAHLGKEGEILHGDAMARETGSRQYCGGLVIPETGALHPALYHQGLLERVEAAGATVVGHAAVESIAAASTGHRVETVRGAIEARDVLVATNGYAGRETPWFRRRLLPVAAQMIATEPLDPKLVAMLLPGARTNLNTRAMFSYWRASPDGTRVLFGGRTGVEYRDPESAAREQHGEMVETFPELASTRVSHLWSGQIGFTRDRLPHIGVRDGVHFAMGMNGAGLPMGTYLGHKSALRILGNEGAATAFDGLGFNAIPLYTGRPWFVPLLVGAARLRHRRERPPREH